MQLVVLTPTDEAIDYFFMLIHKYTGDGLLWLTGTVGGLWPQAFGGISSGFMH